MALTAGNRLGPYEIVAPIGAGGMGEVYQARDTRLNRDVAIKVLPEAFSLDHERLARFKREAQVLASLNHPHIGAIYGFEDSDGIHALVLELIEGPTLADRIARGAIPATEAVAIARQIADALEAAHERGIVHRDLKPANIKLRADGTVKVLDFGLAKAMDSSPGSSNLTHSPTLSLMATQMGVILGTAAYMSPEQAKGLPADHRSDVFSFGVVLYEMLTGRQPFHGETAPDVLASVLARDPDLAVFPPTLHPRLVELVKRCLDKQPKRRWQAIGDVRAELETIAATPFETTARLHRRPGWASAAMLLVALVAVAALSSAVTMYLRPATTPIVTRFMFTLGEGERFTNDGRLLVAISPDGARMIYVANTRLYIRAFSELNAKPIAGSEGAQGALAPAFSPDGQSVAFWAGTDQAIKRISINGGAAVTVCPATRPTGVTWDKTGIIFGQGNAGIMRVAASGGKPELIVKTDEGEVADSPSILPDGRSVLFTTTTAIGPDRWDKARVVVQQSGAQSRKVVIEGASDGRYVPTGHIVYATGGTLFAVPFDVTRMEITGASVPVIEGIKRAGTPDVNTGIAHFSVAGNGSIVYVPGPLSLTASRRELVRVDSKGRLESLPIPPGPYEYPRISPDGKRLAFSSDDGKEVNVWIYDLAGTAPPRRLTNGGRNRIPMWSGDGARIAFQSDREGDLAIFAQPADGSGVAVRLTRPEQATAHFPESWASHGDTLLLSMTRSGHGTSLWSFSLRDNKAEPFGGIQYGKSVAALVRAAFSPDARWVAYSDEGGVYVQPFPATGAKYLLVPGHSPVWSRDGKRLFFVTAGSVSVVPVATVPGFSFGSPTEVVGGRLQLLTGLNTARKYDVGPDDTIVGMMEPSDASKGSSTAPQINVVLNWFEELKERAPVSAR
jgi:eukaryotic-like serine/threonine-protein kinase